MAITVEMRTQVSQLYVALFGRAPDGEGLGYWVNELNNGKSFAQIADAMYATSPARATYPTFFTNAEIVTAFYTNVLGKVPDDEGKGYWAGKLAETGATPGKVIADMIWSVVNSAASDAQSLFNNKVTVAQYYGEKNGTLTGASTALNGVTKDVATVTPAKAAVDGVAAVGQTFTLTNGVDNFVGGAGDDSFNVTNTGTSATLGGLDKVDGGAGNDVLNIADTAVAPGAGFALPVGLVVKNVETLNVTTNGSIGVAATAFDVSGITGLTSFTGVAAGDGTTNTNVKAADTTAVTLTAAAAAVVTELGGNVVSVTGGKVGSTITGAALTAVTVKNSAGMTIDNTDTAANGSTTAVGTTLTSVTLDAVNSATTIKGKAITNLTLKNATAGANTVTITNATTGHALTVNVDGSGYDATGTVQAQTVKDAVAKSVTVNATGAKSNIVVSTGAADTVLTSATITGTAALKLDLDSTNNTALATIDGSAATGALTLLNTAVATSIKTGAGNDTFTATVVGTTKSTIDSGAGNDIVTLSGGLVAGSTVKLGAGNDTLLGTNVVSASTATAVTTIDGGAGIDSVSSALINAGNAAQFVNFESVSLQGSSLDLSLLTGSTITGLSIDAAATTTVSNATTVQSLTVNASGTSSTIGFTGVTGSADAYSITFAGTTTGTAALPTTVAAGTVVVNGIENVTIHSGATAGVNTNTIVLTDSTLQTLTIDGSQAATVSFTGTTGTVTSGVGGVSLIDGSAATGKLNIDISGGTFTTAAAGITVKGGTAADTLTTGTVASTLTGGAGNDSFVVSAAKYGTSVVTTITDAAVGDKITFADQGTETFTTTKINVAAATNLATALGIAVSSVDGSTNGAIEWFQYGGNTYIVEVNGLTALGAGAHGAALTDAGAFDVVVKLTGTIDLSTATGAGTNIITLA
jgi:Domain of unknown function (DUF4214)